MPKHVALPEAAGIDGTVPGGGVEELVELVDHVVVRLLEDTVDEDMVVVLVVVVLMNGVTVSFSRPLLWYLSPLLYLVASTCATNARARGSRMYILRSRSPPTYPYKRGNEGRAVRQVATETALYTAMRSERDPCGGC
jgi:hypothetical protein